MHGVHAKAGQLGLENENTQGLQPELRPESQPGTCLAKTLDATPRAGTLSWQLLLVPLSALLQTQGVTATAAYFLLWGEWDGPNGCLGRGLDISI